MRDAREPSAEGADQATTVMQTQTTTTLREPDAGGSFRHSVTPCTVCASPLASEGFFPRALPCGHALCDACQEGVAKAFVERGIQAGRVLRCPALLDQEEEAAGEDHKATDAAEDDDPGDAERNEKTRQRGGVAVTFARCQRLLVPGDLWALSPALSRKLERAMTRRFEKSSRTSSMWVERRCRLCPGCHTPVSARQRYASSSCRGTVFLGPSLVTPEGVPAPSRSACVIVDKAGECHVSAVVVSFRALLAGAEGWWLRVDELQG